MAAIITSDVLDIGSRKGRRNRGGMGPDMAMGNPGQFDLPNVADVSMPESVYHRFTGQCLSMSQTQIIRFSLPSTLAINVLPQ
jgi:hypothetical protein